MFTQEHLEASWHSSTSSCLQGDSWKNIRWTEQSHQRKAFVPTSDVMLCRRSAYRLTDSSPWQHELSDPPECKTQSAILPNHLQPNRAKDWKVSIKVSHLVLYNGHDLLVEAAFKRNRWKKKMKYKAANKSQEETRQRCITKRPRIKCIKQVTIIHTVFLCVFTFLS